MNTQNDATQKDTDADPKNVTPQEQINLEINGSKFGYWDEDRDGGLVWNTVTNFLLEPDAFIEPLSDEDPLKVVLNVKAAAERNYSVIVDMTVFNEPRKFRNEVCTGKTTVFNGGQNELNELRRFVGFHDVETRHQVESLGLHVDYIGGTEYDAEFVTTGKTITKGRQRYEYKEKGNSIEQAITISDFDDIDDDEVAKFLELLPQTRESERILPILSWFYATSFAPLIRMKQGEFGGLGIFGDTGAGKSSLMSLLTAAFGLDDTFRADSTKYVLLNQLSTVNNMPVVFDEYKPSDMQNYEVDRFHNLLRSTTLGDTESRGNPSSSNDSYHLKAPIAVAGEQSVQGAAEERRLIQVQLSKNASSQGSETRTAWSELSGRGVYDGVDVQNHAKLAHWFAYKVVQSGEFHRIWESAQEYVDDFIESHGYDEINGLEYTNLLTMAVGKNVYSAHCDGFDVEKPQESEWEEAFEYVADQMGEKKRTSHTDEFLGLCSTVASRHDIVYETDFVLMGDMNEEHELRLKVENCYNEISKFLKDHDIDGYDLLSRPKDYKDRFKESTEDYVIQRRKDATINRCWCIDLHKADEQIDEFSIEDFRQY